eukprot:TRINITY_DN76898_c0_g1_i1.p1 TRINITY_DN76898_c0_g1~~TRINITY_DN76898_c0_g1_i1.p1  ORF type:complete len:1671 (-),score=352.27 TRINITY_DN76898_c0_g1_i1:23-4909(-)
MLAFAGQTPIAAATVTGRCEASSSDSPYAARHWPETANSCQAALAASSSRVRVEGMFAHVATNFSYRNDLKKSLEAPVLVLPLPSGAVLQGFNIRSGAESLLGHVKLKSEESLPPSCPSGMSYGAYEAAKQADNAAYRVPLPRRLDAGEEVSLQLEYVVALQAKRQPGLPGNLELSLPLPAGSRRLSKAQVVEKDASQPLSLEVAVAPSRNAQAARISLSNADVPLEVTCIREEGEAFAEFRGICAYADGDNLNEGESSAGNTDRRSCEAKCLQQGSCTAYQFNSDSDSSAGCYLHTSLDVATGAGIAGARCFIKRQDGCTMKASAKLSALQDLTMEIVRQDPPADKQPAVALTSAALPLELTLQRHPETGLLAAALWMPPPTAAATEGGVSQSSAPREIVLLLDSSTSMKGARLTRVREAARALLRSLPFGAKFNLVGFSQDSGRGEALFEGASKELDREAFDKAEEHLTEPAKVISSWSQGARPGSSAPGAQPALALVLEDLTRAEGTQLRILLVTDRHPADSNEAISFVDEKCNQDCRIFATGLGWGASPPFVEGIAKAGGGSASFVADRGGMLALDKTLVAHLADALSPAAQDVEVDWKGWVAHSAMASAKIHPVPIDLSEESAGNRLLAMALLDLQTDVLDALSAGNHSLALHAHLTVDGMSSEMRVFPSKAALGASLHAVAAQRLISLPEVPGDGVAADISTKELGLSYRLGTMDTHWVALSSGAMAPEATAADAVPAVPAVPQAVLCAGRRDQGKGPDSSSSAASQSATSSGGEAVGDAKAIGRSELSLRVSGSGRLGAPRKVPKQLSALDFSKLGASLSLRSEKRPAAEASRRAGFGAYGTGSGLYGGLGSSYSAGGAGLSGSSDSQPSDGKADGFQNPWSRPVVTPAASGVPLRGSNRLGSKLSVADASLASAGKSEDFPPLKDLLSSDLSDQELPSFSMGQWPGSGDLFSDLLPDSSSKPKPASKPESKPESKPKKVTVSTRNAAHIGKSLAVAAPLPPKERILKTSVAKQLSLLDFKSVGSSLSLRTTASSAPWGFDDNWRGGLGDHRDGREGSLYSRMSSMSVLDSLFMGSSLSLGGRFGGQRKSFGKAAADHDLSLRSFSRLGSSLAIVKTGDSSGAMSAAAKLSVLDFSKLGSALSLRPRETPTSGKRGPLTYGDFESLASNLRGDGSRSQESLAHSAGGLKEVVHPANSKKPITQEKSSGWVGVEVAGGLIAPISNVRRITGSTCESRHEQARVVWASGSKALKPARVYITSDGLMPPGREDAARLLGELAVPSKGSGSTTELRAKFHVSHNCELTVDLAEPAAAAVGGKPLLQVMLPELPEPGKMGKAAHLSRGRIDRLRTALGRRHMAMAKSVSRPVDATTGSFAALNPGPGVAAGASAVKQLAASAAQPSEAEAARYHALVNCQDFEGYFNFSSSAVIEAAGLDESLLSLLASTWAAKVSRRSARNVAHTAAALAVLARQHAASQAAWALLASRAQRWLATQAVEAEMRQVKGAGLCSGPRGDFDAGAALPAGYRLDADVVGYRRCELADIADCKKDCLALEACSSLSYNGYCCFLFEAATCPPSAHTAASMYSTYSKERISPRLPGCSGVADCIVLADLAVARWPRSRQ